MAHKKKIYVSFDADDILYYNMLQAWCDSETQVLFHQILSMAENTSQKIADNLVKSLSERIDKACCFIVLVSDHTTSSGSQLKLEIEKAIEYDKPIIVVNLNGKRSIDTDLCPSILKNQFALHLSFNAKIIQKGIDTWPVFYEKNKRDKSGAFFFKAEVYKELGL